MIEKISKSVVASNPVSLLSEALMFLTSIFADWAGERYEGSERSGWLNDYFIKPYWVGN